MWGPFLPICNYELHIGQRPNKGKQMRVVNRSESCVPPLYVGVCG